jgi:predicted aspartyl protease
MRSSSNIKVNLSINGAAVAAIIDTAAQVTIISDRLYQSFKEKPPILSKVTLHTAGRDLNMLGYKVGPVSIVIGSQTFLENEVYVAPVEDEMLLGLDFLQQHQAVINMSDGKLEIGHGRISMNCAIDSLKELQVAEVTVLNNTVIPPCSVLRLPCSTAIQDDYVIEPVEFDTILSPRTLHVKGSSPTVCLVNLSDRRVKLKQGQIVGIAHPIEEVLPDPIEEVIKIQKVAPTKDSSSVETPEHLRDLMTRSSAHLSSDKKLICERFFIHMQMFSPQTNSTLGILPP